MQTTAKIIPTKLKSKIPRTLSWPLGAEEISTAFAMAPQFEELMITFNYFNLERTALHHWPSMELFKVEYRRLSGLSIPHAAIERGGLERSWNIRVAPVLRAERKRMHDQLVMKLPEAAKWLEYHKGRHAAGRISFSVVWNKEKDILYCSEGTSPETEVR